MSCDISLVAESLVLLLFYQMSSPDYGRASTLYNTPLTLEAVDRFCFVKKHLMNSVQAQLLGNADQDMIKYMEAKEAGKRLASRLNKIRNSNSEHEQ